MMRWGVCCWRSLQAVFLDGLNTIIADGFVLMGLLRYLPRLINLRGVQILIKFVSFSQIRSGAVTVQIPLGGQARLPLVTSLRFSCTTN